MEGTVFVGVCCAEPWIVHKANASIFLDCVGLNPTTVAAAYKPMLKELLEPVAALLPLHGNTGCVQESIRALIDDAFGVLDQSRLATVNDVPTIASESVGLRLGFSQLREAPGHDIVCAPVGLIVGTGRKSAWRNDLGPQMNGPPGNPISI